MDSISRGCRPHSVNVQIPLGVQPEGYVPIGECIDGRGRAMDRRDSQLNAFASHTAGVQWSRGILTRDAPVSLSESAPLLPCEWARSGDDRFSTWGC
jgi:hypothetical protein